MLASGIWRRLRGVSGGGRAGKPRCWRGQGLRRSALCGWVGGGYGQRTVRIPRRRGSPGVGTGAGGHGPRPFPATWDTSPPPLSGLARLEASRVRGAQTLCDAEEEIRDAVSSRSPEIRLPTASRSAAPCQPSGRLCCAVGTKASGLGVEGCQGPCAFQTSFGTLRARWMRPFSAVS